MSIPILVAPKQHGIDIPKGLSIPTTMGLAIPKPLTLQLVSRLKVRIQESTWSFLIRFTMSSVNE
jgi:hypothetical protein